ncbi:MAG TPA: YihY/virulence factor BrkB family protein [Polyangiales bacterium]|nr:YihY/virulence factor BrkB family protein [Polyangiales bacterium]
MQLQPVMRLTDIASVLKATVVEWIDDNAARVAASLAFYTLLSMAPMVILSIAIAGVALGEESARAQILQHAGSFIGPEAAGALDAVVASASKSQSGVVSTIVGLVVLLVGASGVFGELQYALDTIWGVKPKPRRGVMGIIKERLFSFSMVIGVAFVLLVSLVVSAVLSALGSYMADALPGGALLWQAINLAASLGVITVLFALIFKVVPDVEMRWRDVWVGSFVTAALFNVGKYALGFYLGRSTVASSYGAAGSVVALVVWVYYSSQLVFLGAEFTQVFARRFGAQIRPSKNAMFVDEPLSKAV